jgi:hypothetical protein
MLIFKPAVGVLQRPAGARLTAFFAGAADDFFGPGAFLATRAEAEDFEAFFTAVADVFAVDLAALFFAVVPVLALLTGAVLAEDLGRAFAPAAFLAAARFVAVVPARFFAAGVFFAAAAFFTAAFFAAAFFTAAFFGVALFGAARAGAGSTAGSAPGALPRSGRLARISAASLTLTGLLPHISSSP